MKLVKILVLAAIGMSVASCIQRDNNNYNNAAPNNNYPHNYIIDSSYSYNEEFNGRDNNLWAYTDPADSAYASVTDSGLQYVDYSAVKSAMTTVYTGVNVADNFTVTTRVKSDNMIGLIFGASATSNGYAFYIDTAGNYSIYQEGVGSAASTAIVASAQDTLYALKDNWNTLEVQQANGTWTFSINGSQVTSMTARALSGNAFGYKILPGTIGYASYLKVQGYN
jgi:hypothetical protein